MSNFKTEQEAFWAGEFGDEYVNRNKGAQIIAGNTALFAKILSHMGKVGSLIEFGANVGNNLMALRTLLPHASLAGIEINRTALNELRKLPEVEAVEGSILDLELSRKYDLTLIKGVLIHINPEELGRVYDRLYEFSDRYICLIEYFNPTPVTVEYRGHANRLFKRDFAGEMMDRFKGLKLVNYGFAYARDNNYPLDNLTWFLLEK